MNLAMVWVVGSMKRCSSSFQPKTGFERSQSRSSLRMVSAASSPSIPDLVFLAYLRRGVEHVLEFGALREDFRYGRPGRAEYDLGELIEIAAAARPAQCRGLRLSRAICRMPH
jgi:hypothetical protein